MHAIILVLFIAPLARSYDLAIGLNNYGKKIYDESRQASPAIWRQKENVTIEAAEHEVITKVIIIDMRPEKDGDARIVDGGEGKRSVTIELKSPTVFRGYDFHIFVYSAPENQSDSENKSYDATNTPVTSSDYKLHTNSINTDLPLITTINPVLKDTTGINRSVRTADAANIPAPGTDTASSPPGNSAFGSAVSYASTMANEAPASGPAISVATATSTADSASGSIVSEAVSNSSLGSQIGSSLNNAPPIIAEGAEHKSNGNIMNSTEESVPVFTGYGMNEGTTSVTLDENISSTAINNVSDDISATTTLSPYANISSESNLPELNNVKDEGTRYARKIEEENVTTSNLSETTELTTTTMSDITNENNTELANITMDGISNKNSRHSRGLTDTGNETDNLETSTEIFPELSTILTSTIITEDTLETADSNTGHEGTDFGSSDINETTTILDTQTTTEVYSGDGEDISDNLDKGSIDYEINSTPVDNNRAIFDLMPKTNMEETPELNINPTPNSNESTLNQQTSSSILEQMLRNTRDAAKIGSSIFGDNSISPNFGYNSSVSPIFVDSSQTEEQSNSSEYVYVPIIALVSRTSYPLFQEALQHLPGQEVDSNGTKSVL